MAAPPRRGRAPVGGAQAMGARGAHFLAAGAAFFAFLGAAAAFLAILRLVRGGGGKDGSCGAATHARLSGRAATRRRASSASGGEWTGAETKANGRAQADTPTRGRALTFNQRCGKKVDLRKRSTTATKNYIVETRQGPAPTNVPSEVQCKDRWYVGSLHDQARHQSGM